MAKTKKKAVVEPQVAVTKTNERYLLELGEFKILVGVRIAEGEEKTIEISTPQGENAYMTQAFKFSNSKKIVVESIGKLLIEASKLAK